MRHPCQNQTSLSVMGTDQDERWGIQWHCWMRNPVRSRQRNSKCWRSLMTLSVYSYSPLRKCGSAISREARQASKAPPPINRGRWTRAPKKLTKTMRTVFPTWAQIHQFCCDSSTNETNILVTRVTNIIPHWPHWKQPGPPTFGWKGRIVSRWWRWSFSCSQTPKAVRTAANCGRIQKTAEEKKVRNPRGESWVTW